MEEAAWRSRPGRRLPKTGIFPDVAGDYRRFRFRTGQIRSLETGRQFAKARHWRAFLALRVVKSLCPGLAGWRRSADRTRLQANSLLTGNYTGNFAISGLRELTPGQEIALLQALLGKFPTQINRENISRNRKFLAGNREFCSMTSMSTTRIFSTFPMTRMFARV